MSEFEAYLRQLRAHLDVSAPRAEEIIAETYSHLDEHTRQLVESGLSREEAVRAAEEAMGDPTALAAQITRANGRYRAPSVLRALAGVGVMFAATFSLAPMTADNGWVRALATWIERQAVLGRDGAAIAALALALVPAALVTGLIAGRRYWWVAVAPPMLLTVVAWGDALLHRRLLYATWRMQLLDGVAYPLLAALLLGLGGCVGGRSAAQRPVRALIVSALSAPYLVSATVAVLRDFNGVQATLTGMVIAEGAAVLLLLAMFAERRTTKRQLLTLLLLICGVSAVAFVVTVALLPLDLGTLGTVYGALAALAGTVALAAVVGALRMREAARGRPHAQ
jgi:hypothetical protein